MATHTEAEDTLISTLLSNRPTVDGIQIPLRSIKTPNAPFNAPKSQLWMRIGVVWDEARQLETGFDGLDVAEGTLFIDTFCELNKGNKAYKQIQTQLIELYNKKRIDCVDIYNPAPRSIGVDESWYHYQLQFTCRIAY